MPEVEGRTVANEPDELDRRKGVFKRFKRPSPEAFAAGYLVVAISVLIVLRATVDRLAFIGIGWLIALALIPLVPWALPRLGAFIQTLPRYVSRVGIGTVEIELRDVRDEPITVPTSGGLILPSLPGDLGALSTSTGINEVIAALRALREQGGAPCGIIDLKTGKKWRLPNVYYLSVMLEVDPVVATLFFTEMRAGIDGYFVRMSQPAELRRQIEQALPDYRETYRKAVAAVEETLAVQVPKRGDLSNIYTAEVLANTFNKFREELPTDSGDDNDPLFGYLSAERLSELVISPSGAVVESPGETLTAESLRIVVSAADRYVPTTNGGRLSGLIDRDAVALVVARAAGTGPIGDK